MPLPTPGCIIDEVGQIWDDPTEEFMTLFCANYALRSGPQLASQRHLLEDSFVRMVERGLTIGKEGIYRRRGSAAGDGPARPRVVFPL